MSKSLLVFQAGDADVFVGRADEEGVEVAVVVVGVAVDFLGGDVEVVGAVDGG